MVKTGVCSRGLVTLQGKKNKEIRKEIKQQLKLEERRESGDLLLMFKAIRGLEKLDRDLLIKG